MLFLDEGAGENIPVLLVREPTWRSHHPSRDDWLINLRFFLRTPYTIAHELLEFSLSLDSLGHLNQNRYVRFCRWSIASFSHVWLLFVSV
jgi:hypothetical protein